MTTKRGKADYENAVKKSMSIAGMCRYLGLKPCGGNYKIMHKAIKEYDLDINHFTGQGWNTESSFPRPLRIYLSAEGPYLSNILLIENKMYDTVPVREFR